MTLGGVERANEQGPEDAGLNACSSRSARPRSTGVLLVLEGERLDALEEVPIEARKLSAPYIPPVSIVCHRLVRARATCSAPPPVRPTSSVRWKSPDGRSPTSSAKHEKTQRMRKRRHAPDRQRDSRARLPTRRVRRDLLGHSLRPSARIPHPRLLEDVAQESDVLGAGVQRGEIDAPARGKVSISTTPAIPHHEVSREVEHHQKRWRVTGNVRDIGPHLAERLPHQVVVGDCQPRRLPLQGETVSPIAVDPVLGDVAVAFDDFNRLLEAIVVGRRTRCTHAECVTEVEHEALKRGRLVCRRPLPLPHHRGEPGGYRCEIPNPWSHACESRAKEAASRPRRRCSRVWRKLRRSRDSRRS